MYKSMFPLLAVLVVLALGFFTLDFDSDVVGSAHGGVEGYFHADEFFYGYQTLVTNYSDGELSVVVNGNVGDVFVYKNAYYDLGGAWTAIELESTSVDEPQEGAWNDSWIRGSAEGSVEVDFDEYYVVAYVCRLYNRSDVLSEQNWNLDERLLINHTFESELDYLCGVGGFVGGELVTRAWHLDQVACEGCAPDSVHAICGENNGSYSSGDDDWSSSVFCSQGLLNGSEPDFPNEGDSVSWECLGEHGGDNVTCSASRDAPDPVNALCGSHNRTFPSDDTLWPTSGTFCDEGTLDGNEPGFPTEGGDVSWTCLGTNGGSDDFCTAQREVSQPDGSETNPYLISTCQELQDIDNDLTSHYVLANDIDCSGTNFDPIGVYYGSYDPDGNYVGFDNPHNLAFTGSLDGMNHSIVNLEVNRPSSAGLFGMLGYPKSLSETQAKVNDLYLQAEIVGDKYTGVLSGYAGDASITNVHVQGLVSGNSYSGGMAGMASGSRVQKSSSQATINGGSRTGGLLGGVWGTVIQESYSTGPVSGEYRVGGLVGDLYSSLSTRNSYSRSSVSGVGLIGGFVGHMSYGGQIENSFSSGMVSLEDSTQDDRAGGFITGSETVTSSYWDTQTSGFSSSDGGVGKTTSQMKTQSTYSGWDFTNVWAIDSNGIVNDGYPYLRNNPPEDGSCSGDCGFSSQDFCANRPGLEEVTSGDIVRAQDLLLGHSYEYDGFIFESVFLHPFPAFSSPQKRVRLFTQEYASMRFRTPKDGSSLHESLSGKFNFNELVGSGQRRKLVAISPCEGDFRPEGLPKGCVKEIGGGVTNAFRWTFRSEPTDFYCELDFDKEYYFNIFHTDAAIGDWPLTSNCDYEWGRCGNTVTSAVAIAPP